MNKFREPLHTAVITLKGITSGVLSILYVVHDQEGWQFLSGGDVEESDGIIVALERIIHIDNTVSELGDLPLGWHAWRATPTSTWQRSAL